MMHPLKQCIQQQQHGPQSRCQGSSSTRWSHGRSSSSRCGRQQSSSRRLNPTAALVEPGQLAVIAAEPVAEVALLAGVGAACARQGLLPLQGRRVVATLVLNVFTPALLFSKLGTSVDIAEAVRLWPLAANMLACHVAGLGLGWLQIKTLSVPASLAPQVTVMTALGNVGNLPLVLIPALISRPGVLELMTGATVTSDTAAAANAVGIEYVMLGFFYASFIQFPLGYLMLQKKPGQQQQQQPQRGDASSTAAPVLGTQTAAAAGAVLGAPGNAAGSVVGATASPPKAFQQAAVGSNPSPAAAVAGPIGTQQQVVLQQQQQQAVAMAQAQPQQAQQLQVLLKGIFTPPVLACLLAIPVASLPELKSSLFDPGGDLRFLGDVVTLLGAPLIPCLFLVLGANLAEGPGVAQVPLRVLMGLLTSKLVLHPLIGLLALLAALQAGVLRRDTDPLMLLVMLLVWCPPTAVLTHSLATMLQNGEDQVSYVLFWQYLTSVITLPLCLGLYLQLLQSGLLSVG